MKRQYQIILYRLCLIITGISALNISMNSHFIKQLLKVKSKQLKKIRIQDSIFIKQLSKERPQSEKYNSNNRLEVAIYNNKAYWIKDNTIYCSRINQDGNFNPNKAKRVDVFSLSSVELDNIMKIVDSLNQ